jgi:hypothetical protein
MANNPKIKRPFTQIEYTKEMVHEMARCIADPVYFIKKYVYILHPKKGRIKFDLYPFQEEMIRAYQNNRYCISKIARQSGKTETTCAYIAWFALFHSEKTILVASNKLTGAKEIINRIQTIYEELPDWLKPGIDETEWNKTSLSFENGSKIMSQATSANTGRGYAISLLYLDELAFVPPHIQRDMWISILPVLSTGGSCIISSTPNGSVDLYSELFRQAQAGENKFHPIEVKWYQVPGRDDNFKKDQIGLIGERKWRQEYECEFLTTDYTLIDLMLLDAAEEHAGKVEYTVGSLFGQIFWKAPNRMATYVVGVDPAQGTGNDYSVIEVFEFPSMEQVAEYRTNEESPASLYSYLKSLLRFLEKHGKHVYYSVENNALGQAIIALYEADPNPLQSAMFMSEVGKNELGYNTNVKTKNKSLINFKEMFERGQIKINSKILLKELKTLVRKENTFKAQIGSTDDCVFATLICVRIIEDMAEFDMMAYNKINSFNNVQTDNWQWDKEDPYKFNDYSQKYDDFSKQHTKNILNNMYEDDGYMPFSIG